MFHLRPYQTEAIDRVRAAMRLHPRVLLALATGAGKTVTGAEVVRRCASSGLDVLWIAHRAELVDQAAATLTRFGLTVGSISASAQTPPNPFARVQVATIQTLLARGIRPKAGFIVNDECHHAVADQWSTLYDAYPGVRVLGLTATPERSDGRGLDTQFDSIVVGATVRELTELGALVPCEVLRPDRYLSSGEMAQHPVDAYVAHGGNRPTIMFARGVELAQQYTDEFNMRGIKAGCVHGDAPWSERAMYLDAFRAGRIQVLVNVFVLTEGFDAPETSCVILARGCSTAGTYLQMVGRALRPAAGKKDALILDLRGVSHEFGRPDHDRVFALDGKGIRLKDSSIYCPVCGAEREAGEGCLACGWQPAGEPMKGDKVTGDKLVKYAAKRAEGEDDRIATLGRWLALARAKGHREGAALHKFKAVYGTWPTADVIRRARGGVAA